MLRQRKKAIKAVVSIFFIFCAASINVLFGTKIFTSFEIMFFPGRSQAKSIGFGIVFVGDLRIEDCGVGGSVINWNLVNLIIPF